MNKDISINAGILVDDVEEVKVVKQDQIMPPPATADMKNSGFIYGIIDDGDQLVMLIDLNAVMNNNDMEQISQQINAPKEQTV